METRQKIMAIGSAVVIGICVIVSFYFLFFSGGPPPLDRRAQVDKIYFYDLKGGELFSAGATEIAPINAPGQAAGKAQGMRAYVMSCGDCSKYWVGWLERFTPEAKALMQNRPPALDAKQVKILQMGRQIRAKEGTDKDWVWADSEAAQVIKSKATKGRCPNNKKPSACHPTE